jgi:hypothetical protein
MRGRALIDHGSIVFTIVRSAASDRGLLIARELG